MIPSCRRFQQALTARSGLAEWSARVSGALRLLGWPGARERDSAEQQTLEKFNDILAELATLDDIVGSVNARSMLRHLRSLAEQTPFQPETGDAPISVSARLADPGLGFDGLWVTGLEANSWPRAPRPDPFLPWEAQRTVGIPDASAAGMLALAQQLTARWSASATEVIFSWPERVDDEACLPSALISALPKYPRADALATAARQYWLQVRRSADLERSIDETGPALLENARMPGGAHSLTLQSQCAMHAFAERRLDAPAFDMPEPGIDARTRGSLVHHALWVVWSEIESQEELRALDASARDALCRTAVAQASARYLDRSERWSARIVQLERERLCALLEEWLVLELDRTPFRVVSAESTVPALLAGHPIELRIDRIDTLGDGRRLLIDYKTSSITPASWFGERPEDAQLPVYAAVLAPAVDGIAIGRLRVGDVSLRGASSPPSMTGGQHDPADWSAQLALWRDTVGRLAREFVQGDARVNPRQPPQTCRYCQLHSFCRIDEIRIASVDEGDEDE
jgi:ATP-dependent helicase/nuclease subunit B